MTKEEDIRHIEEILRDNFNTLLFDDDKALQFLSKTEFGELILNGKVNFVWFGRTGNWHFEACSEIIEFLERFFSYDRRTVITSILDIYYDLTG
jgi:hypothetical protein